MRWCLQLYSVVSLEFLKDEISFLQIEQHPPPSPPPLGIDMEAPFPTHDKLPQGLSLTMS